MSPMMQFVLDHLPLHFMGMALLGIAGWIGNTLGGMLKNIQTLNVQVAVVLEKLGSHEQRISRLEQEK